MNINTKYSQGWEWIPEITVDNQLRIVVHYEVPTAENRKLVKSKLLS